MFDSLNSKSDILTDIYHKFTRKGQVAHDNYYTFDKHAVCASCDRYECNNTYVIMSSTKEQQFTFNY